ncbi:MAG: hypothetical protein ACO1O6_05505 [Bacteroidota bacterium]
MIRFFSCLVLASALNLCFGREIEPFRPYFEVLSVKKDKKVSRYKCLIEGQFYDYRSGEKIGDVTVERGDDNILLPDGSFAILMKLSKPSLKMYTTGSNMLVFDKFELKGGCRMKLKFYLESGTVEDEPRFEVKKPVIYCYSEKNLSFELALKPKGSLNFVYPPMLPGNTWKLAIRESQLYDLSTDVAYPYLFWESCQLDVRYKTAPANEYKGDAASRTDVYRGDIVARDNLLAYLDTSLMEIGFTEREKTDFITFWVPQMQKYAYCLVQFQFDEECEQFAIYEISPAPDKVNRVYLLYSGFETYPYIKTVPKPLRKMKRKGFYLVDWGGVELPAAEDLNAGYEQMNK